MYMSKNAKSVKANVCLKECDTDWGAGMSYCQRKQFLQCAKTQGS